MLFFYKVNINFLNLICWLFINYTITGRKIDSLPFKLEISVILLVCVFLNCILNNPDLIIQFCGHARLVICLTYSSNLAHKILYDINSCFCDILSYVFLNYRSGKSMRRRRYIFKCAIRKKRNRIPECVLTFSFS